MTSKAKEDRSFRRELIQQLITLSTSGFGLVAALAWNETIQSFVKEFILRRFPTQFGIISQLIYALIITGFAVFITYQLSHLASRWDSKK